VVEILNPSKPVLTSKRLLPVHRIALKHDEPLSNFACNLNVRRFKKVETIGDCYMCAAGYDGSEAHAERMVGGGAR